MNPFDDLPAWTMAEWMGQKAEIDRLRAELAEWERRDAAHCPRAEKAEAAIARVRELCESVQRGDNPWQWPAMILRALDGAE